MTGAPCSLGARTAQVAPLLLFVATHVTQLITAFKFENRISIDVTEVFLRMINNIHISWCLGKVVRKR